MVAKVKVVGKFERLKQKPLQVIVDTTSRAPHLWETTLSPFHLGPIYLYDNFESKNFENGWQFSKVYPQHADKDGNPTQAYWSWAMSGWESEYAQRYPMGKGAIPLYSLWKGKRLKYIEARKKIYGPLYMHYVQNTEGYHRLREIYENEDELVLRDFDGYDHEKLGMSLTDVLYCKKRKMGHAFFLKILLTNDDVLDFLNG